MAQFFQPLRQAVAAFFRHDIALRRADDGVHIVLEERADRPGKTKPASRAELNARKERQELDVMRLQLAELLGELPETRQTMRHLVFVEQALAKKGLKALRKLPLEVLERALEQLEGLVTNWSPVGLASLRSRMAVSIIDREHMDPDAEVDAYRTAAVFDNTQDPELAEVQPSSDDEALAAAYAAMGQGAAASEEVEVQAELGSPSARALAPPAPRVGESGGERGGERGGEIELRVLSD
ncbi:MAG: hypothetical protein Q8K96_09435 [Rubrivivax sp.]|nr:hypothetical protein [Rubrivivax sp.]